MNVKQWGIVLIFFLFGGCRGERAAATATIAPAEPRPAPTQTATIGEGPMITTSGSPVPASVPAPGMERVTVSATEISMRELIPRGHTAFHITNETPVPHDLVLRSASGTAVPVAVAPVGRSVLQAKLTEGRYALICTTPGHSERAEFRTYVPGTRPQRRSPARP